MISRLRLGVLAYLGSCGLVSAAYANPMRVDWDGPACIATDVRGLTGDTGDTSPLLVRVIKPLHWSNLPFSTIVSIHFSLQPTSQNYDQSLDIITVEGGKTQTGTAEFGSDSPRRNFLKVQINCVGEFENFTAMARTPRTPGAGSGVYRLNGFERVDDAVVSAAIAQQQPNKDARMAKAARVREEAAEASRQAKQMEDAAVIASAELVKQMQQQPVGSTLFCATDPKWARAAGDAVDRQRLICHLVGKPNSPPMMGAALLSTGWNIVSENRRTTENFIMTADMGPVETTELTLRKSF